MNRAVVVFQIMDDEYYISNKNIYSGIAIETMQFENSMFSKAKLVGAKLYVCRYKMYIYGIKMFKNTNIPITKELEDFICSIINNSKFIKENNIKAYELDICINIDRRSIFEVDNYINNNYKVLSYPLFIIRLKSNKEFIVRDD